MVNWVNLTFQKVTGSREQSTVGDVQIQSMFKLAGLWSSYQSRSTQETETTLIILAEKF